jgi:hypothetical protein
LSGTSYYYAISAIDWAYANPEEGHESSISDPKSVLTGDKIPPAVPTGLVVEISEDNGRYRAIARWDRNTEDDFDHYNLYVGESFIGAVLHQANIKNPPEGLVEVPIQAIQGGYTYIAQVDAVDTNGNYSARCASVEFKLFDEAAPSAPTWDDPNFFTTVGANNGPGTITLKFNAVTLNDDGTPCTDLFSYAVYLHGDDGSMQRVSSFTAPKDANGNFLPKVSAEIGSLWGGRQYTFSLTATDLHLNESEHSAQRSITCGDPTVPKAPASLEVIGIYPPDVASDTVKFRWDKVIENEPIGNNPATPCTDLAEYIVMRGALNLLVEYARVPHNPATNRYEFTDNSVTRYGEYYYSVVAVDTFGNRSAQPAAVIITVGDTAAPGRPEWVSDPITQMINNSGEWEARNTLVFRPQGGVIDADLSAYVIQGYVNDGRFVDLDYMGPADYINGKFTYIHTGLKYLDEWCYRIYGFDVSGNKGPVSELKSVIAGSSYSSVVPVVTATSKWIDSPAIGLSWTEVPDAASYKILRSDNGTYFPVIGEVAAGVLTYDDKGLKNGYIYQYKVVAVMPFGGEAPSNVVSVMAGETGKPTVPILTIGAQTQVDSFYSLALTWTDSTDAGSGIDVYEVWRTSAVSQLLYVKIAETADKAYTDYGLTYGKTYKYKIIARDHAGNVCDVTTDNEKSATISDTQPLPNIPAPTVSLEATNDSKFRAVITWAYAPPMDFFKYEVMRKIGTDVVAIWGTTDKTISTYTDEGLIPGGNYSYGVVATDIYDNKSTAVYSSPVTPQDTTKPARPNSVTATTTPGSIILNWPAVTANEDASALADLSHYEIKAGLSDTLAGFVVANATLTATSVQTSYQHVTGFDNKNWCYAVRSVDVYGNASTSWRTAGPFKAGANAIDTTKPAVVTLGTITSGIEESGVDISRNFYISISWTWSGTAKLSHFNLYINGQQFTCKTTSYIFNGLIPYKVYTIGVSAQDIFGNESDVLNFANHTIQKDPEAIAWAADASFRAIRGNALFSLIWTDVSSIVNDLDYYELQVDTSPTQGTYGGNWKTIFIGKTNHFVHGGDEAGRLDYLTYYVYRVKAVDTSGNSSVWHDFEDDDNAPAQTGTSDIGAGTIIANLLASRIITTEHISALGLDATVANIHNITAQCISAHAIESSHLNIGIGGTNHIKNSAFGMKDSNDAYMVNWTTIGSGVTVDDTQTDIPIPATHCIKMVKSVTGQCGASQNIPIEPLRGSTVTLSGYMKGSNIVAPGGGTHIEVFVEATSESKWYTPGNIDGTIPWSRRFITFPVPQDVTAITIYLHLEADATGTLWFTGLQLETGDVITPWNPHPDEVYGAQGNVQINYDGIRIRNGNLSIKTDSDSVTIDSLGIKAEKTSTQYAQLDNSGLTVKGGAMSLMTADSNAAGLVLDGTGLRAYSGTTNTVSISTSGDITVTDGKFTMTTGSTGQANPAMIIDNQGIVARSGADKTFELKASDGTLNLYNGKFGIYSGPTEQTTNCINFTGTKFEMYGTAGRVFYVSPAESKVEMIGNNVKIATASSSSRVEFTRDGISGYYMNEASPRYILGSDGIAHFNGGGISINSPSKGTTTDGTRSLVIDMTLAAGNAGIYGYRYDVASSSNVEEWHLNESGAKFVNADISDGAVRMDSNGLKVSGVLNKGITVVDAVDDEMVYIGSKAAGTGIFVRKDGGITLEAGGIKFSDGTVGITKDHIVGSSIKAGTMTLDPSVNASDPVKLVVKKWVDSGDHTKGTVNAATLNESGLTIYNGSLNIYSGDTTSTVQLMSDGKILASALSIGSGGDNMLLNGRADFDSTYAGLDWSTYQTPTVTIVHAEDDGTDIVKSNGIASRAFKISTSQVSSGMWQCPNRRSVAKSGWAIGETYTLSCYIKVVTGSFTVLAEGASPVATGVPISKLVSAGTAWQRITFSFVANNVQHAICIYSSTPASLCYITDICVVHGDIASSYIPHSTELWSSQNVQITPSGAIFNNGSISITSAGGALKINNNGLTQTIGTIDTFKLTSDGMYIDLDTQSVSINKNVGILSQSGSNSVQISGGSITINGDGNLSIYSPTGHMKFTGDTLITGIWTTSNNVDTLTDGVRIDQEGLTIVGDKFDIRSTANSNSQMLRMTSTCLALYSSTDVVTETITKDALPSLYIGFNNGLRPDYAADLPAISLKRGVVEIGLNPNDIAFNATDPAQDEINSVQITNSLISSNLITKENNQKVVYTSKLTGKGLEFLKNGVPILRPIPKISVQGPLSANGSTPASFPGFTENAQIVVVPIFFQVYDDSTAGEDQNIQIDYSKSMVGNTLQVWPKVSITKTPEGAKSSTTNGAFTSTKLGDLQSCTITTSDSNVATASVSIQMRARGGEEWVVDSKGHTTVCKVEYRVGAGSWYTLSDKSIRAQDSYWEDWNTYRWGNDAYETYTVTTPILSGGQVSFRISALTESGTNVTEDYVNVVSFSYNTVPGVTTSVTPKVQIIAVE